jgi:hypothetical protein
MKIGIKASGLMLATTFGGILMATQLVTAPPAQAVCSGMTDPVTGICWSGSSAGGGISGTGGTCLPGRLGLCLGALQNSQIPGANLPSNTTAGANRAGSWP